MKIAIAQLNYKAADPEYNAKKIKKHIAKAREASADVVVFAEGAVTGLPIYDHAMNDEFIARTALAVDSIVAVSEGITVVLGMCTSVYDSALVITDGKIVERVNKRNLTSRYEYSHFAAGSGAAVVKIKGKRVVIAVGDDAYDTPKADLIINPAAVRFSHDTIADHYDRLTAIGTPTVFVNAVGGSTDVVYYGGSAYIGKGGVRAVQLPLFDEGFEVFELKHHTDKAFETGSKIENVHRALILAIRDYFGHRGFGKACLGLSGGIDSAVVVALAVEALGAGNVRVLLLPSQFSSDHSITDAVQLAETLGIQHETVYIEPIYRAMESALSPIFEGQAADLTEENLQSRIRGTLMMALSNKFGNILLNTSNKSEAAMGYGTLYGDTNGSLSLLGDLYKTEVYELARYINRNGEIIPQNSIDKAPSAELRHDQKDSDSLPEYDTLDAVLFRMIELGQSRQTIVDEGFDAAVVDKIASRLRAGEYKRYQLCPSVMMSHCVLGKDRIYPL